MEHVFIVVTMVAFRLAPILIIGVGGWLVLSRTTTGRALLARLRRGEAGTNDVLALASAVERLERDLADIQERLNYTERLVMQQGSALPPAPPIRPKTPTPPDPPPTVSH